VIGILVLIGVLVLIFMSAKKIDRYPWPWMSFVLIIFIFLSSVFNIPLFANALMAGVVVYLIMKKFDEKGVTSF